MSFIFRKHFILLRVADVPGNTACLTRTHPVWDTNSSSVHKLTNSFTSRRNVRLPVHLERKLENPVVTWAQTRVKLQTLELSSVKYFTEVAIQRLSFTFTHLFKYGTMLL